MKKFFLTIIFSGIVLLSFAQQDHPSPFSLSGYIDTYYVYDFNKPRDNTRPSFIYSYNRHNEVNLNLGFIKGSYKTENVRGNLALMTGTYANANLASEPGVLKNIFEANAGVKLSSKKNLWVDAGIFQSHIGFESAIGKDCWNLTRSILADNSPYYESGAKISYTTGSEKWFFSVMVLNGWQRIQRIAGSSLPSWGTQVTYKPNANVTLNSSTFIGTNTPDSTRQMRYFHNLYGIFQVTPKIGLRVGFDSGVQDKTPESTRKNLWYSPVIIAKFGLSDKATIAVRAEYYHDEHGVIIATGTPNGFQTTGLSANFDYNVASNALWRFEVRNFHSRDKVFHKEKSSTNSNAFVSTSLAINF
jgi:hypothetical protein